jgi:putative transposase
MDDREERQRRAQAIRHWLRGKRPRDLLRQAHRSRAWLSKWRRRFAQHGRAGFQSRSRRPRHSPRACSQRVVQLIVQTRRRLVRQRIGLIGPRAIRRELRQLRLGRQLPSLATIKRVLRTHGLITQPVDPPTAYFPHPQTVLSGCLHAIDWTCRYLETGPKVYAFHTFNLRTRACAQTIALDKSTPTVRAHVLAAWETLGIPHFLQLDNDAVFNGGSKVPRVIGQFVRLCLYVGVEVIFLPVAEPERNGVIEHLNQPWNQAFFNKRRFASVRQVVRSSPNFVQWYLTQYAPPALGEHTPHVIQRTEPQRRLSRAQRAQLPEALPVTAGRIHFIPQVAHDGTITLLNESWPISRRLAGKYVWATVTAHRRQLEIWYQRSAQSPWRLRKTFAYDIPETIAHLKPEFAHED